MSKRGTTRIELNIATGLLMAAMVGISAMPLCGFENLVVASDASEKLSRMTATDLLAMITILSLGLSSYLIRLLFGRLLTALDANTRANADMAKLLAERPCIRNPKND